MAASPRARSGDTSPCRTADVTVPCRTAGVTSPESCALKGGEYRRAPGSGASERLWLDSRVGQGTGVAAGSDRERELNLNLSGANA